MTHILSQDYVSTSVGIEAPEVSLRKPLRILHVVSKMDRAGIETWLMHALRNVDRKQFQMDFLIHSDTPGHYDEEIRARGSKLLCGVPLRQAWKYGSTLKNLFRSEAPYDIVHSHVDYFSGYPLKYAHEAGTAIRIAHSHNDLTRSRQQLRLPLKLYALRSQSLIARHATHGLAASTSAGESLFSKPRPKLKWRVLHCGVELTPFSPMEHDIDVRREFGISDHAAVVGHVGRFNKQKNHQKIVDIAESLSKVSKNVHFVLVGDGPLRSKIEEDIRQRGLADRVTLTGVRADIPRLFTSLFDVLLLPSLFEGLPLVVIESLAAGCHVVMSDVITPEANIVPSLVTRESLSSSAERWAEAVMLAANTRRSCEEKTAAFETVRESPFNISNSLRNLTTLYRSELTKLTAA